MRQTLIAAAVLSVLTAGETRAAKWVHRYSSMPGARTEAVVALSNGGFVFAAGGVPNAIVAVDADGQVRQARTLAGKPKAVAAATSGNVFVAFAMGGSESADGISKLKAGLTTEWSRRLEIDGRGALVTSLDAAAGGGVIVAGAAFLAKLDAKGRTEWAMALTGAGTEIVTIRRTTDGGYVCVGASDSLPWLAKVSGAGELEWQKRYGSVPGTLRSVIEAKDGGFVVVGSSQNQALVVHAGASGEVVWSFMTTLAFPGHAIVETPAGYTAAFVRGGSQIQLGAFSRDGAIRWQRIVTEPNDIAGENGSLTTMFAPAADGVVFGIPSNPEQVKTGDRGPRLYSMDDAGQTSCESAHPSATPLVSVRLAATPGQARLTPIRPVTRSSQLRSVVVTTQAVVETCHYEPTTVKPAAPWFTPRDQALVRANHQRYGALLLARDFDALEQIAGELRRPRLGDPMHPYDDLSLFYASLASTTTSEESLFASLREWQGARPASITASIALVNALYRAAWNRRGHDYDVTELGRTEYHRMLDQAGLALKGLEGRGDPDPRYWMMLIAIHHERDGADVREIARRALRLLPDPEIAWAAGHYLLPRWGGSAEELVAFADEAARLTRQTHGDVLYTSFAYQIADDVLNGDENLEDYKFDWERARRGGWEAISMSPKWISSYHRLASLAEILKDQETLRELFAKKEMEWFDDALWIWHKSSRYDRTKKSAMPAPDRKKRVDPVPVLSEDARPSMQPSIVPPAHAPAVDPSRWPNILLQTQLTAGNVTHDRIAAFLVHSQRGIVAVSAAPSWDARTDNDNVLARLRAQFGGWTMSSPARPRRAIHANSFLTLDAPNAQLGVALVVKVSSSNPPVNPLKIRRFSTMGELGTTLFVVGCTWDAGRCRQSVFEGRLIGMHQTKLHALRILDIGLLEVVAPESFSGGAVLDANGDAIAVATSRGGSRSAQYKTIVSADVLDTVVP